MADAKYFQRGKPSELLTALLSSPNPRPALKKIIANMTMGNDMSTLLTHVIQFITSQDISIRKMVLIYIVTYAKYTDQSNIRVIINALVQHSADPDPVLRALAIRTMSYINIEAFNIALVDVLLSNVKDSDPYVRKTVAFAVAKLHAYKAELVLNTGLIPKLYLLLADANATVIASAVAAIEDINLRSDKDQLMVDGRLASRLMTAIPDCNEWSQCYILNALMTFVPQERGDAESLAERITARLQHTNAAVVLTAIRVILYLTNYMHDPEYIDTILQKTTPPLITCLRKGPEIQYVALRNAILMFNKSNKLFSRDLKVFFIKYNDPIYVKMTKLELLVRLTDEANIDLVLSELKEYAQEIDVDFVRKAVRSIGRCTIKIETAADKCMEVLISLIHSKVNYVVQEATVVIKDIFRRYPNRYESVIATLCDNLDSLDEPEAKASMIWIIGQYADRIENSDELMATFLETFLEDPAEVQFALLTATVKLMLKRPSSGKEMTSRILKQCTEEVDNPDLRDRGFLYWRLLSSDPAAAKAIVFADRPKISSDTDLLDQNLLDSLLLHFSSLASIYHRLPETFIGNAKPLKLQHSDALTHRSVQPKKDTTHTAGSLVHPSTASADEGLISRPSNHRAMELLDFDGDGPPDMVSNQYQESPLGSGPQSPVTTTTVQYSVTRDLQVAPLRSYELDLQELGHITLGSSSYVSPKILMMNAQTGKGLEVNGTFARAGGKVQMQLTLSNRSMSILQDWAVQFNKNSFGICPADNLSLQPMHPQSSTDLTLPLAVNVPTHISVVTPINQLQIALKHNGGICYFATLLPLRVLFAEDGDIPQTEFLDLWNKLEGDHLAGANITGIKSGAVNELGQLKNTLHLNNIFIIASRMVEVVHVLYISSKVLNSAILAEIRFTPEQRGLHTLSVSVRATSAVLVTSWLESFEEIMRNS